MHPTAIRARAGHSLPKSLCSFVFLVAFGGLLLKVNIRPPEKAQMPAVVREDVLSAADARQWRQEFLWRRNMEKVCKNAWIDDNLCVRAINRL